MYCIAQFQKIKSAREIGLMANHNLRLHLTKSDKGRIDPARTKLNRVLENTLQIDITDASDMNRKFAEHWKQNDIKIKSDSVLLVDVVLTTSPEFWGDCWHKNGTLTVEAQKKLDEWLPVQIDFIKKHFGPDALKFAVLHLDEKTPHIHLMLSPEETKSLKYKNQYGAQKKKTTSLNANRWNPNFWKKFVTAYAKVNEKFKLKRPTEDSMSQKITLKEYDKLLKEANQVDYTKVVSNMVNDVLGELGFMNSKEAVKNALNNKLVPRLQVLAKSNKAVKELLELDREQEYKLLKKLTADAQKKLEEATKVKEYHGNKLKIIQELEAQNKAKDEIIEAQRLEIERLNPKQKLTANDPSYKLKA